MTSTLSGTTGYVEAGDYERDMDYPRARPRTATPTEARPHGR